MKYINLTQQKLILPDGTILEPFGTMVYVKDTAILNRCGTMTAITGEKTMTGPYKNHFFETDIPLFKSGVIIHNLPEEQEDVTLIVPKSVLTVGKGDYNRKDLLAPVLSSELTFYLGRRDWRIPGFYC